MRNLALAQRRPFSLRTLSARQIGWTAVALGLGVLIAYPWAVTIFASFKNPEAFTAHPLAPPTSPTLESYSTAWETVSLGTLTINSLIYACGGAALGLAIAIFPAYAFSRHRIVAGKVLFALMLLTIALPRQAVVIPLYEALNSIGFLNTRLGIILVYGAYSFPYEMLFVAAFMSSIPAELEEACRIDGGRGLQVLWRVVLPLSAPGLAVAFTLSAVAIWKDLIFPLTFLADEGLQPLTVGLIKFTTAQTGTSFVQPAAGVIVSQIPLLVVYVLAYRWIRGGLLVGGIRG